MKKFMKQWIYICAILTALWFAPICRAEVVAPLNQLPQLESLRLPSFSIFGWDKFKDEPKLNVPYSEKELQELMDAFKRPRAFNGAPNSDSRQKYDNRFLPAVALVMFRSRRLFAQSSWSTPDMEEGRRISRFFARLMNRPELEIHSSNPGPFRDGLVNIRKWYADLCNRNSTLGEMFFTIDTGPNYGFPLPRERYSSLELIESKKIPGRNEQFALFTDGKTSEPIFIGVLAPNGALKWAARFNKNSGMTINGAYLSDQFSETIDGYGFVCRVNQCRIYLDENLNLRFYFVSW